MPKTKPKTNAERQATWQKRQTLKRRAVMAAFREIIWTTTFENDLPGGGGKANIKWDLPVEARRVLEAYAAEKGFDLDAMLQDTAIKAMLRGLPPGKVIRENG